MAIKGPAVPVFRRPNGHAEAGPIIRRANDPMTEADITCAIMRAGVADEASVGKARVAARGHASAKHTPMDFPAR